VKFCNGLVVEKSETELKAEKEKFEIKEVEKIPESRVALFR
jgi:hypothetical protein